MLVKDGITMETSEIFWRCVLVPIMMPQTQKFLLFHTWQIGWFSKIWLHTLDQYLHFYLYESYILCNENVVCNLNLCLLKMWYVMQHFMWRIGQDLRYLICAWFMTFLLIRKCVLHMIFTAHGGMCWKFHVYDTSPLKSYSVLRHC